LRILHIWDQASVACIFAKYQQLQGHDSKVILIRDRDKYGVYKFYEDYVKSVKSSEFIESCIQEANSADIIHIHSLYSLVAKLRAKFGKSKTLILHYHGTDLRAPKAPKNKILYNAGPSKLATSLLDRAYLILFRRAAQKRAGQRRANRLADAILVAAHDLLRYAEDGIYIPIPVDTDHFKPDKLEGINKKEALTIDNSRIDIESTIDHLNKNKFTLDIDIHNRTRYPIMYESMPSFLKKYRIYVDIRFVDGKLLDHLSTTAEQSLACGLSVLDYELKYRQGLPAELEGKNVVVKLSHIYSVKGASIP
jgi:hypothetical protein